MKILGVNTGHDAAAALYVDGDIVAFCKEERLTRKIIERETNPLYYDILKNFRDSTGIPCLVNTSFNAHEEPIINTPQEALRALYDKRIDFLVCDAGLVFRKDKSA